MQFTCALVNRRRRDAAGRHARGFAVQGKESDSRLDVAANQSTEERTGAPDPVSETFGATLRVSKLQKGQLFRNGRTRTRDEGHYRAENCTKQEAPPEDKRPTISRSPSLPAYSPAPRQSGKSYP